MTIKNAIRKPMATVNSIGPKPGYMDAAAYKYLQNNLGKPLPISSIHYFDDGRLCSIAVYIPTTPYMLDDVIEVNMTTAMLFHDETADVSLTYVD